MTVILLIFLVHYNNLKSMRILIIVFAVGVAITGCSKSTPKRINFAELKVDSLTFTFDSVSVERDTMYYGTSLHFMAFDRASGSRLTWEAQSASKYWINGTYKFREIYGADRSLSRLYLGAYVNRYPKYYQLSDLNSFTMTINQSENGRVHGIFEGTLTCNSCAVYGQLVPIDRAEFEMPYTYTRP
jgi:hypothetical protein